MDQPDTPDMQVTEERYLITRLEDVATPRGDIGVVLYRQNNCIGVHFDEPKDNSDLTLYHFGNQLLEVKIDYKRRSDPNYINPIMRTIVAIVSEEDTSNTATKRQLQIADKLRMNGLEVDADEIEHFNKFAKEN